MCGKNGREEVAIVTLSKETYVFEVVEGWILYKAIKYSSSSSVYLNIGQYDRFYCTTT